MSIRFVRRLTLQILVEKSVLDHTGADTDIPTPKCGCDVKDIMVYRCALRSVDLHVCVRRPAQHDHERVCFAVHAEEVWAAGIVGFSHFVRCTLIVGIRLLRGVCVTCGVPFPAPDHYCKRFGPSMTATDALAFSTCSWAASAPVKMIGLCWASSEPVCIGFRRSVVGSLVARDSSGASR
jgi:hypothetical protein